MQRYQSFMHYLLERDSRCSSSALTGKIIWSQPPADTIRHLAPIRTDSDSSAGSGPSQDGDGHDPPGQQPDHPGPTRGWGYPELTPGGRIVTGTPPAPRRMRNKYHLPDTCSHGGFFNGCNRYESTDQTAYRTVGSATSWCHDLLFHDCLV